MFRSCLGIILGIFILPYSVLKADIIFIRHGEADHNISNLYNSNPFSDAYKASNLTSKGKCQVGELAEKMIKEGYNDKNIVAVYASPLPRTLQTADILSQKGLYSKCKLVIDLRLRETNFGELESQPEIDDEEKRIEVFKKHDVESNESIEGRLREFYEEIKEESHCGTVLVISHAYQIKMMIKLIWNEEVEELENSGYRRYGNQR